MTILNYPITRKALASMYKISTQTFAIWLQDIGIMHNRTLSPADLKKVINTYDMPSGFSIKV